MEYAEPQLPHLKRLFVPYRSECYFRHSVNRIAVNLMLFGLLFKLIQLQDVYFDLYCLGKPSKRNLTLLRQVFGMGEGFVRFCWYKASFHAHFSSQLIQRR